MMGSRREESRNGEKQSPHKRPGSSQALASVSWPFTRGDLSEPVPFSQGSGAMWKGNVHIQGTWAFSLAG